ncbi:ROK family protein [Actinomycetes bacterium KLBMP 9797]
MDLGGTAIKWVVLAGDAVADRGAVRTPGDRDAIVAALAGIARAHGAGPVGLGVPGHVDRATGVIRFLPNLPGAWSGFPLGAALTARTGRPVRVLNDARAFCLAELRLGAARDETDALFLTLGTGVGGGVVSAGRLLVGPDDRLGEIGHTVYDRSGPRCGCGGRGCLEMYASGPAIVRQAGGGRTPDVVAADATAGEPAAVAALALAGRAIGETVASLAALLPCRALIVGGGVAGALPVLRPHIEAALASRAEFIGPVRVRAARLGDEAGAVGAALTVSEGEQP